MSLNTPNELLNEAMSVKVTIDLNTLTTRSRNKVIRTYQSGLITDRSMNSDIAWGMRINTKLPTLSLSKWINGTHHVRWANPDPLWVDHLLALVKQDMVLCRLDGMNERAWQARNHTHTIGTLERGRLPDHNHIMLFKVTQSQIEEALMPLLPTAPPLDSYIVEAEYLPHGEQP